MVAEVEGPGGPSGICLRTFGRSGFVTGEGMQGVVGALGEADPASAIGSRDSEKADAEALGEGAKGDIVGGGRRSWSCNWPSRRDCFRA